MKLTHFHSLFMSFCILLLGCGTQKKIEALKPAPSYGTEVVYDKQLSYINLPVQMDIADIQNQTNKYLNGLLYEDNKLEDDNLMLKVWKQAPILLNENKGKIDIVLPLKIWTKLRYGISQFGVSAYDTREFNFNGSLKLTSLVGFKNWKITTATQITGIDWAEAPTVAVLGKNVPITALINPAVSYFKGNISKMIDDAIAQSFDVKPYVSEALEQLCKPMEFNTDYHTWFAMQPLELYTSEATVANKKVNLLLGMKAYLETAVNSKPTIGFDKSKLAFTLVAKPASDFNVSVAGIVTYQAAAELMKKNFAGQTFSSGNRSITITDINLWGKDGKMIVELGMKGSVNGNFYMEGVPVYNPASREVYIDQADFVLDSKSKLLKLGDWLAHGLILNKIKASCHYSVADQLTQASATLKTYTTNYQPMKGVKVNGTIESFSPGQPVLTPNAIITMINAKGTLTLNISGMD